MDFHSIRANCGAWFLAALLVPVVGCRSQDVERAPMPMVPSISGGGFTAMSLSANTSSEGPVVDQATSLPTPLPAVGSPEVDHILPVSLQLAVESPENEFALAELVAQAMASNPQIQRVEAETRAAWQRVPQARAVSDPMVEGSVFGEPQLMADGEMRGTFMVSQALPYLKRLDARGQQTAFEAMMLQQETQAVRLQVAADVEESWYRLYLIQQLLRINDSNRELMDSLVEVATNRVEVGETTAGDVLLGTLEISRIEEERLTLEQQLASRKALLNQQLNLPSDADFDLPEDIEDLPVTQSLDELRTVAYQQQPAIAAARLRTSATAWGISVARYERTPELMLSYEHMFMKMNPGEHGGDPWRVGVGMNLPLWHRKYDAMEREAQQRNIAAHRGVDEVMRETDAMLLDLLEQARAAESTARLYRETILPQSRQALESDQRAYAQGMVTFERVVSDAQNLLTAESAYHRALSEKAIALARLKQAVGGNLPSFAEELALPPPILPFNPDS